MALIVNATIRGLGTSYKDGVESMEIHVLVDQADGLPYTCGVRTPIVLYVNKECFRAGLRATTANKYIWICPDVETEEGTKRRLAHILTGAGFKKNDKIGLIVNGTNISLAQRSASQYSERICSRQ